MYFVSNLEQLASCIFPLNVTVSLNSLEGVVENSYQHVQHQDNSEDDVKKEHNVDHVSCHAVVFYFYLLLRSIIT